MAKPARIQWILLLVLALAGLFGPALAAPAESEGGEATAFLSAEQESVLGELFQVHLNYFLAGEAITEWGLPLTAYQAGDRARFGYSNPTEWGYALQAWIAGAERGLLAEEEAVARMGAALATMRALQQDGNQHYQGLFYPFYTLTDAAGNDIFPAHDANHLIPSGDNALLYLSLVISEGYALRLGETGLATQARSVREAMHFRDFLFGEGGGIYLAHLINADSGAFGRHGWKVYRSSDMGPSRWDVYADEGGLVAWVAYFSESISWEEYQAVSASQLRTPARWISCEGERFVVREAAWFNAMFTWGVRSLGAFPSGDYDGPPGASSHYSRYSFVPAVRAHLAYGDCLGIDYPAFSDAMTQAEDGSGLVGGYTPPNLAGIVPEEPPAHVVPHALFIPFNAGPDLPQPTVTRLLTEIVELRDDAAGYYHDTGDAAYGFEVIASGERDDLSYSGADAGRDVFETLSTSYILLSLFNGLQLNEGDAIFYTFAAEVPGYEAAVIQTLDYLRSSNRFRTYLPRSSRAFCAPETLRFGSGDSPFPEEQTVTFKPECVRTGENVLVLESGNQAETNSWFFWDSLALRSPTEVVWALGVDEAPPDYSDAAFDEFDRQPPYNTNFDVNTMTAAAFPAELNDSTLQRVTIHFTLTEAQAQQELVLDLDTLYATHDSSPYFTLSVRAIAP